MSLPQISVVIPAWNAQDWIAETLASVSAQTYPANRLEVIVVDDGSSDDTREIAERVLAESGLSHAVLHQTTPIGPSAARNLGWRRATGSWIQFLDADDLLEPAKIAVHAERAERAAASVAAVFSSWGRLVEERGRWVRMSPPIDPAVGADAMLDLLRAGNFIATGSQLFRREWLDTVGGFTEAYRLIEDVDLLLRLAMCGGVFEHVPSARPLFWYRQRAGSLSRESERAFADGCLRNAGLAEEHWRTHGGLTADRARVLAEVYFGVARSLSEIDPVASESLVARIDRLRPAFVPPYPARLRLLARLMGYRRAEGVARRFRQLKRRISRGAPA